MSNDEGGPFSALQNLHHTLVRQSAAWSTGTALYPRAQRTDRDWWPSLAITEYRATDASALGLEGSESFHDLSESALFAAIIRVVDTEGPVHFELLGNRLLDAAGVGRMGSRIRERIENALRSLECVGEIVRRGDAIGREAHFRQPPLRDWRPLPDKERKLDHVADTELMACLFYAVLRGEGSETETAMNDGLDRIGFPRLTQSARERMQSPLQALTERGEVRVRDGRLYLGLQAFVR